jgi:hypothetical protein
MVGCLSHSQENRDLKKVRLLPRGWSVQKKQGTPWKKAHFFLLSHFSSEWDRQPAFKFDIDYNIRLIYRLIPKSLVFLYELPIWVPLQSVAFSRLLVAFTDPLDIQMHGSRYHSIAKHCIVLPVKFDGGLYMSILRLKQLFTKKKRIKSFIIKKVQIFKKCRSIGP